MYNLTKYYLLIEKNNLKIIFKEFNEKPDKLIIYDNDKKYVLNLENMILEELPELENNNNVYDKINKRNVVFSKIKIIKNNQIVFMYRDVCASDVNISIINNNNNIFLLLNDELITKKIETCIYL